MEDQINAANPLDLHAALQDVEVPASTAALVDAATVAGAPLSVMETLATLPDREWRSVDEVVAAATSGFRPTSEEPADPPESTDHSAPGGGSSSAGATATPSTAAASNEDENEADSSDGSDDNPLLDAMDRIESERRLDSAVNAVDRVVQPLRSGGARVALGGKWLGHALHPLLTDLPIGCWLSSALLDLTPGGSTRIASKRLVAAGIVFAVPTALSGASDWSLMSDQRARRVGVVHAGLNTMALAFYAWSWNLRRHNRHWRGMLAGFAGGGAMIASGYLGGHLSFGMNAMPAPADGTV
jgi:hypothetical protein